MKKIFLLDIFFTILLLFQSIILDKNSDSKSCEKIKNDDYISLRFIS